MAITKQEVIDILTHHRESIPNPLGFTIPQIAKSFGISLGAVRRAIATNELPHEMWGPIAMVDPRDLAEWLPKVKERQNRHDPRKAFSKTITPPTNRKNTPHGAI